MNGPCVHCNAAKQRGSVFVWIIIVLCIASMIGISGLLYWEKEKITQQYFSEMEKAQIEKNTLREQVHKEQKEKEKNVQALRNLELKYNELQQKHTKLENEYKDALNIKQFVADKFIEYTTVTKDGWRRFEDLSNKFNKQIATFSEISSHLFPQFQERIKDQALSSPQAQSTPNSIELPTVIVKDIGKEIQKEDALPERTVQSERAPMHSVQIMSINREHNFVVINKGIVDGIDMDDVFTVKRDQQVVATIKVKEVRDFVSLALIQEMYKGLSLREGDTAFK